MATQSRRLAHTGNIWGSDLKLRLPIVDRHAPSRFVVLALTRRNGSV